MNERQKYGILWSKSLVKVASGTWVMGTYLLVLYGVVRFCAHLAREDAADVGPAMAFCVFVTTMVNWAACAMVSDARTKQTNDEETGVCR